MTRLPLACSSVTSFQIAIAWRIASVIDSPLRRAVVLRASATVGARFTESRTTLGSSSSPAVVCGWPSASFACFAMVAMRVSSFRLCGYYLGWWLCLSLHVGPAGAGPVPALSPNAAHIGTLVQVLNTFLAHGVYTRIQPYPQDIHTVCVP